MQIARWLHLMGVVVWIGGMFFAHFALRPSAQALPPEVRLPLLAATLARFFGWVAAAVVAILASGVALSEALGGFRATGCERGAGTSAITRSIAPVTSRSAGAVMAGRSILGRGRTA